MDSPSPIRIILVIACLALSVGGCSRKSDDAADAASAFAKDDGILRFIPADTPYAFASVSKLPEDVREKLTPVYSELMLQMMREGVKGAIEDARRKMEEAGADPGAASQGDAFAKALEELLSPETLENTGISSGPIAAIYGVGLLPVARITVDDMGKLEATLARLEKKSGEKMAVGTVGGKSYRYAGDEQGRVVIAQLDDYLVLTIVPTSLTEDGLKAVLGLDLPGQNIAAAGHLSELAKTYGFTPYAAGYIDVQRIAATFLDNQSGTNAELLTVMGYDNSALSDICKTEIRAMSGVMPRIAAGYNEVSTERMASTAVLELRADIASSLSALAAPVPGLGKDHGGLMSFGIGLDLLAARKFYEARLDAMDANPYKCELLAEFQAGAQGGRAALDAPLPPIVYGIKGFLAVIDNVEGMDLATQQPPTEIDMSFLIATDNAAGLIAMGSLVSPELAAMDLKSDGKPVEVPLPPMGQPFATAQVAMNGEALGLGVGKDAGARISALVASDIGDVTPVMSVSLDMARYYEFAGNMIEMSAAMDQDNEMSPESIAAISSGMKQFSEMFDRMSYDILLTERGIEVPSVITLAD